MWQELDLCCPLEKVTHIHSSPWTGLWSHSTTEQSSDQERIPYLVSFKVSASRNHRCLSSALKPLMSLLMCICSIFSLFLFPPFISSQVNKLVENMFAQCTELTKIEGLSSLLSFCRSWDPSAARNLRKHLQDGAQLLPPFLTKGLNRACSSFKVKICTINHSPTDDPRLTI